MAEFAPDYTDDPTAQLQSPEFQPQSQVAPGSGYRTLMFLIGVALIAITVWGSIESTKAHRVCRQTSTTVVTTAGDGETSCDPDTINNIQFITGSIYNWIRDAMLPILTVIDSRTDDIKAMQLTVLNEMIAAETCHPVLAIPAGGLVISGSGCWRLTQAFTYEETNPFITVIVSDVILDLGGFVHGLSGEQIGVLVSQVNNTRIRNGGLRTIPLFSNSTLSRGVLAYGVNCAGLSIEGVHFEGLMRGVDVNDVDNVRIERSSFTRHKGYDGVSNAQTDRAAPLTFAGSNNVVVRDCTISDSILSQPSPALLGVWSIGTRQALSTGDNVTNLRISDVRIHNSGAISLFGTSVAEISDVMHTVNDSKYEANFFETAFGCENVLYRDSYLSNPAPHPAFDGMVLTGRLITVKDTTIKTYGSGHTLEGPLHTAGIHIGQALTNALFLSDTLTLEETGTYDADAVQIKGCRIYGTITVGDETNGVTAGIYLEPFVRGAQLEGNQVFGVRAGAPEDLANNHSYDLHTAGILLHGAYGAHITRNLVSKGANSSSDSAYNADGIVLEGVISFGELSVPASRCTVVSDNVVIFNGGTGIRDSGDGNLVYRNVARNNGVSEYSGTPIVVAIGDAALEGSNL